MIRHVLIRIFSLQNLLALIVLWLPLYILLGVLDLSLKTINLINLVTIFIGCGGVAATQIARDPRCLWYPLTWFLLTSAIYYGFGPLLYYFSHSETVSYVDNFYPVSANALWRVNILTSAGVAGVIAVYMLVMKGYRCPKFRAPTGMFNIIHIQRNHLWRVAIFFMAIGVPIKIILALPRALGLWDVILPGAIENLSVLSTLALIPLSLIRSKSTRTIAAPMFYALLLFEVATAFAMLSKLAILKVAIALLLAWVLQGVTFKRLAAAGILLLFVYAAILTPLVTYGRIAFNVAGIQSMSAATALTQVVATGDARDELASLLPGVQGWWSRLNYANAQAFAMDAYDRGMSGDTFMLAAWVLVPRILLPEKPITTTGAYFNELVTGNPESKSAPGMFAEGYWNAGLIGLVMVVLVMGFCFGVWQRYSTTHLASLRLQYLPVTWLGLFPAIQQDSWFVPGTIGMVPIAIVFHWLARIVFSVHVRTSPSQQLNDEAKRVPSTR